tara:strand:- start:1010 stop:1351 length:342 start_codon:yes stop_codon:yes gene_type:complete
MQVKGTIYKIDSEQVISDKFKKREFVVETMDEYPQLISIQLTQDRTGLIDIFNTGDEVTVSINLRGRKWTNKEGVDKFFNTVEAWRIEGQSSGNTSGANATQTEEDFSESLPF